MIESCAGSALCLKLYVSALDQKLSMNYVDVCVAGGNFATMGGTSRACSPDGMEDGVEAS